MNYLHLKHQKLKTFNRCRKHFGRQTAVLKVKNFLNYLIALKANSVTILFIVIRRTRQSTACNHASNEVESANRGVRPQPPTGVRPRQESMRARSDVIGSLLRPPSLIEARQKHERGRVVVGGVQAHRGSRGRRGGRPAGKRRARRGHRRRDAALRLLRPLVDALEGFDKFGGWAITFRDGRATTRRSSGRWSSRSFDGGGR